MKIDGSGDVIWWRTFGSPNRDALGRITATTEGEFIIAGVTYVNEEVRNEVMLLKVTADGDSVWMKTFGTEVDDNATKIVELSDGRLAAAGYTGNSDIRFSYDYYLALLTGDGDLLWSRTYGGPNDQFCHSLTLSSLDGGFLLAGSDGRRGHVNWLVRTDSTGEELWTLDFGNNSIDGFAAVTETRDHCYVMAGTSDNGNNLDDIYLVKTAPDPLSLNAVLLDPAFPFPFSIFPCYPNPFNSSTRIAYTLPSPSDVQLRVYDLMGWEVATLFEGRQMAGNHQTLWDGRNSLGAPVSSGVYFVRLETPEGVNVNRVVIQK